VRHLTTIEQVPTRELVPYARNAKKHSEGQVQAIAASIREFGFNNPLLIDRANGVIAGHGRLLAAQLLGYEDVPCIRLEHLTENEKRAYILADNRLGELGGGWDSSMLEIEVEAIMAAGVELGFLQLDEIRLDAPRLGDEQGPPPEDFKEYGDDIETNTECPKCGFRWSKGAG
jgi:ParB-like chromosome segregation protein Spo0J